MYDFGETSLKPTLLLVLLPGWLFFCGLSSWLQHQECQPSMVGTLGYDVSVWPYIPGTAMLPRRLNTLPDV